MKSCYGYVRVSTVRQGDGVSLEAQKDAIVAFAQRHDIAIGQWFEETVTAAKSGRPLFNKLVAELKRGRADGVIFHKIDRSARNFADWARIGDLAEAGVAVHFATETLDFNSRGGRLTADIQAVIAADYVRNLREETIKGLSGRLKQGIYPFKAPLGYLDTGRGNAKAIDPVRGPLVRRLFELYATGEYSLWSLTAEAAATGLLSEAGRPVGKTSIEKILRNRFYTGIIHIRRTGAVYQGVHQPLITSELFERVAAVRLGRDNKKETKHNHLYHGLFRCGHCERGMVPELQKGHVYYRCRSKGCTTKTVREESIGSTIEALLKRVTLTDEQIARVRSRLTTWIEEDPETSAAANAHLEIANVRDRLARLTDKFVDDLIDEQAFNERKGQLLIEQAKWTHLATTKHEKRERLARLDKFCELTKSLYFTYQNAVDRQKREIVKFVSANRKVFAKNVCLEPSKWVVCLEQVLDLSACDHSNDASRTEGRYVPPIDLLLDDAFEAEFRQFQQAIKENHKASA